MIPGRVTLDLTRARAAVQRHLVRTPLLALPELGHAEGRPVALKLENLQLTGSFKARGAACKMVSLSASERERGVVACSSGNHGRAVARLARLLDVSATICVPSWIDPAKLQAIREDGAEVILAGESYDQAEKAALEIRERRDRTLVHPFDDPLVIAGQGTVGLEIVEDLPTVATVAIPLSGGGLASGVAYAMRSLRPSVRVIAVSAERAAVMVRSQEARRPVELPEEDTLASALSGGIGLENLYTFGMIGSLVDEHVLVTEGEIERAVCFAFRDLHLVVEGGGAVALAALLAGKLERSPGPLALVISGGNLDLRRLAALLAGRPEDHSPEAAEPGASPGDGRGPP